VSASLALLRHAPTAWNLERRLQGRADVPLAPEGRAQIRCRRVPEPWAGWRALASPLARCIETATLLGLAVAVEPRLVEMDWGAYQGLTFDELRARFGADFAANERRGLDLAPPDGESPRAVQARLAPLLAEIAAAGRPTLAVAHRGVIRAVYARAVGWDMTGEPADALDHTALQIFALDDAGGLRIERLNVALEYREGPGR